MLNLRQFILAVALSGPLWAASAVPAHAELGASQISESMSNRAILEAADASLEHTRSFEAQLDAHLASMDPQSDSLAAELRSATAALAEVRGYLAVAEQHRATLETLLAERETAWDRVEHAYSMVWTACNQAVARAEAVLQGSSQASRYTGERLVLAVIDPLIPVRDTTETGAVEEIVNLPGVEDRAVDSPVF